MSSDSGTMDKEVGSQAKGYLQVWFNPHDGQKQLQKQKIMNCCMTYENNLVQNNR